MSDEVKNDVCAKANEMAVEALRQLLTIAGGVLALTLTFLKDFAGSSPMNASGFLLVPLGWILLSCSIWLGWVAIAHGARQLGTGGTPCYVFGDGLPRKLARRAQWMFFAGLLLLGAFATLNFLFPAVTPKEVKCECCAVRCEREP